MNNEQLTINNEGASACAPCLRRTRQVGTRRQAARGILILRPLVNVLLNMKFQWVENFISNVSA